MQNILATRAIKLRHAFAKKYNLPIHPHLRKQLGIDGIQLGLVLTVVAVIIAGGIVLFGRNLSGASSNSLGGDMMALQGSVKTSYANNYGALSTAGLHTGGFFKSLPSLNDNAGVVTTNQGGGTLTVAPGRVNVANDSAAYTITGLPDDGCQPLIASIGKGAATLTVNGAVVKAPGAKLNPAAAACANDNNTIVWQFF
ncbi:hypothetical protein E2P84_42405 [Burkholderia cepacia]|uniref:Type 4 secretion system PilS N-terminal domain-containing protein n=1 Tax=Burkholderia cepacia TaxID=292 RepID=A0AAX2RMT6_BURCE|nr:type 4 pilus major pilin [Burkholderia cepacia]TES62210.1 hypothetical protein E2P84_42405 [Burkholderia cepacia]TET01708.1 hypothetical protein E3D36_16875 [Burkholderia cepacia]TEU47566.1 hypothetical protein E3D37_16305 [Burkholderia cepacia]TEU53438.1 hypothetical protein E3D38_11890 [Burkholderia cepacia]TEV02199.1 hypothetical protein E3D40_13625 [Burkholderia cepacia]